MAWSRSGTSQTLVKLLRSPWVRAAVVGLTVIAASRPVAVATAQQVVVVGRTLPQSFTADEAANPIRMSTGRLTVVILYGQNCPRSQAMFPGFVQLANLHAGDDVRFATFAMDRTANEVPEFLSRYQAPFDPFFIRRPHGAALAGALASFGFRLHPGWQYPYIAVLGRDGRAVGQWEAATNLQVVENAIRGAL